MNQFHPSLKIGSLRGFKVVLYYILPSHVLSFLSNGNTDSRNFPPELFFSFALSTHPLTLASGMNPLWLCVKPIPCACWQQYHHAKEQQQSKDETQNFPSAQALCSINGAKGNIIVSFLLVEVFRREIPDLPDRLRERISISPPSITEVSRHNKQCVPPLYATATLLYCMRLRLLRIENRVGLVWQFSFSCETSRRSSYTAEWFW